MATTQHTADNDKLLSDWERLYRNYYQDEIQELLQHYPQEQQSLLVDYQDIYQGMGMTVADDLLNSPKQMLAYAEEALQLYDAPVDVDLSKASVHVTDLPEAHIYGVAELRESHNHSYIGVEGNLSRVTEVKPKITNAAFECQRCGSVTEIPQTTGEFQEPHECRSCERQGPFQIDYDRSTFVDRRKVQVRQPPEEAENGEGASITVYLEGDVADPPGVELHKRVGQRTVVYGIVDLDQDKKGRNKSPVFSQYLIGHAFEFDRDSDDVDIAEHKDTFTEAANSPNAYQKFIDALAKDIYPKGRWPLALRLGAAYLFGGNRVDPPDGSTYRGDIHIGLIGPPGVAKSQFSQNLAAVSPGCEHRSATGLSSDVGLTAAAVQDDFADGDGWVLKPGILPRAEHHVILDEADKADVDLSQMNDALEGEQMSSIDKGGINAKLKTRIGLAVNGNPDSGRWDENMGIKEQIDIPESLWSRFDGIVLLQDEPDESEDDALASHVLENYQHNLKREKDHSDNKDESDDTLSQDTLRAWVKYARENITPELTDEAADSLRDYYVDIRTDGSYHENSHPTPRKLETGIRLATAFAKLRLSETVSESDVEMAIDLSKQLLGQTLYGEGLDGDVFTEAQEQSQKDRKERIKQAIVDEPKTVQEIAEETNVKPSRVEKDLEKWHKRSNPALVTENQGEYRWIG